MKIIRCAALMKATRETCIDLEGGAPKTSFFSQTRSKMTLLCFTPLLARAGPLTPTFYRPRVSPPDRPCRSMGVWFFSFCSTRAAEGSAAPSSAQHASRYGCGVLGVHVAVWRG